VLYCKPDILGTGEQYELEKKERREEFERDIASYELHPWDTDYRDGLVDDKIGAFKLHTDNPLTEFTLYIRGKRLPHGKHCVKCNEIRRLRKQAKNLK